MSWFAVGSTISIQFKCAAIDGWGICKMNIEIYIKFELIKVDQDMYRMYTSSVGQNDRLVISSRFHSGRMPLQNCINQFHYYEKKLCLGLSLGQWYLSNNSSFLCNVHVDNWSVLTAYGLFHAICLPDASFPFSAGENKLVRIVNCS
jgi:hypothetical protein